MDAEKYLNRLELYFILPALLAFLFIFTLGLTSYSTDPDARWYQLVILMLIPTLYLTAGLLIKKQSRLVWIFATLLAAALIIHAAIKLIGGALLAAIEMALGLILMMHLLRKDVGRYYWE
jgi:hypothetical protein